MEHALQTGALFRNSPYPVGRLLQLCGNTSVRVLGTVNPSPDAIPQSTIPFLIYTNHASPFPHITYPSDPGVAIQIIVFDRPSPTRMQYLSLSPIPLSLGEDSPSTDNGYYLSGIESFDITVERDRKARLIKKLRLHTVVSHQSTQKELLLPTILNQINASSELAQLIMKNVHLLGTRPKRSLSVGERMVESATTLWYFMTVWVYPLLTRGLVIGLVGHRIVAELILRVLEWRPHPESAALKDVSATAQQVDIRLQQFCYWPIQYLTVRKRKNDWESITDKHPDYIRFYNSLWLVANDVIIGIALGSYIIDNAGWVADQINQVLSGWTVEGLRDMILWLMNWPAGLKLNNELAIFLGDLFLWVIYHWRGRFSSQLAFLRLTATECIGSLRPYLPQVIYFIGFWSFAGATMPIALFSDLLSLLTVHIYCFYTASARIFHWQLTIIISLFHLFRGKKHNVLRNRIDSCDYDLDQLLLGTILFTVLFFLLPTVIVFYLTFTAARMAIIFLKASLDTLLAFLNHFPLFAFMLRIKDSRRLPGWSNLIFFGKYDLSIIWLTGLIGGICFDLQDTTSIAPLDLLASSQTSHIFLKVSIPPPFPSPHSPSRHYFENKKLNTPQIIP